MSTDYSNLLRVQIRGVPVSVPVETHVKLLSKRIAICMVWWDDFCPLYLFCSPWVGIHTWTKMILHSCWFGDIFHHRLLMKLTQPRAHLLVSKFVGKMLINEVSKGSKGGITISPNIWRGTPGCQMWTFETERNRCQLWDDAGMQVFSSIHHLRFFFCVLFYLPQKVRHLCDQIESMKRMFCKYWIPFYTQIIFSATKSLVLTLEAQRNVDPPACFDRQ